MDKISRHKKYNSNKTSIQISKLTHFKIKEYCKEKNIKIKNLIEEAINSYLK
jgi:hypothetical protein